MTSPSAWLIAALLVQGAIAVVLVLILGSIRVPLVQSRTIRMRDIALTREPWPEQEKKVSNAFDNQFQLPVLLYLAGGVSLYFGTLWLEVVLAWLFLATRIVHAYIHASSNRVETRFFAYTAGVFILIGFWIDLSVRLIMGAAAS